ncbi:MAG: adenosylcobinamide-GDP ribazoletransferase [Ruminiclostridium sp.]|nr:adenosylcobinamide-GDP ribazoletransferase [Ruminiclostridium sp.]
MTVLKSLISAFSMYSAIPMPKIEWREENHRYSLCFFPLIGAVIGWLYLLWFYICASFGIGAFLRGSVSAFIPLLVTGGIHADGFCDVTDARKCLGDRKKKLAVMSDPHVGAFAVISAVIYLILQAAVLSEIKTVSSAIVIALVFVMSRCFSGLAAVTFRCAKKEGTLQSFSRPAHKTVTILVLVLTAALAYTLMLFADIWAGAAALLMVLICMLYYGISAYRNFGGITGDTEGWFLQLCEITAPAAVLIAEITERALTSM